MFPIKMMYKSSVADKEHIVDVYAINILDDTLETFATCWMENSDCWLTVPIFMLSPIKPKKKKMLQEAKENNDDKA